LPKVVDYRLWTCFLMKWNVIEVYLKTQGESFTLNLIT